MKAARKSAWVRSFTITVKVNRHAAMRAGDQGATHSRQARGHSYVRARQARSDTDRGATHSRKARGHPHIKVKQTSLDVDQGATHCRKARGHSYVKAR
eukprot:710944-Pleurochrysis_carterae.AAC.1